MTVTGNTIVAQPFTPSLGGLNTLADPFSLKENESPKCNDIIFSEDSTVGKRLGHEEVKGWTYTGTGTGKSDFELGAEILFTGTADTDYRVEIDGNGTPDTFRWSDDGGSTWDVEDVPITGALQTLNNGVQIKFRSTTGHTIGDLWDFNFGESDAKCNGLFDYGVSPGVRKLVSVFGTQVKKMDDLNGIWTVLDSSRPDVTHFFEKSGDTLIICSDVQKKVRTWDGTDTELSDLNKNAPEAKIPIVFQGFLMLMNTKADPRRIYYEDESSITSGDWDNFFAIDSTRGDEIVFPVLYNGQLYVSLRNEWSRVTFVGGSAVFQTRRVSSVVGAVPKTVKVVSIPSIGEVIIYLGWNRKIYLFDGTESRSISDKYERGNGQSTIFLNNINVGGLKDSHAVVDENTNTYRLYCPMLTESQPSHSLNINLNTLSLSPFTNQRFTASVMAEDSTKQSFHIGGGYNHTNDGGSTTVNYGGKVFKIDKTYKDVSVAIDDDYVSPKIFGKNVSELKKAERMNFFFDPVSNDKLKFFDRRDFEKTWKNRTDIPMFNSKDNFLGANFVLGTAKLGSRQDGIQWPVSTPNLNNSYQYRLSSNSSTKKPWRLNRVEVAGKALGIGGDKNRIR